MFDTDSDYVNTIDYKKLEKKFKDLASCMDELAEKNFIARKLRYAEVDVEGERARGKLQPDELLIPQHIIDTNIRREQSSYVQYVTQSPRAVILQSLDNPAMDTSILERDVTNKVRFDGWQIAMFANIDGMQQNGYGVLELTLDQTQPGELAFESVQYGDLGFVTDTKDIQEAEIVMRNYYFSKTRLLQMASDPAWEFSLEQVNKVIGTPPHSDDEQITTNKDRSLYKIQKAMFRVNGTVQVGWIAPNQGADDWLRLPRPLYIGRRKPKEVTTPKDMLVIQQTGVPLTEDAYETRYPYFVFPYLISENNTISMLKGRAFLDQDCQQAATSLISSFCTAHRRAAGLYFSKDVSDPNDDLMLQKNVFFKPGALINSKIQQFQLTPPTSDMIGAVNLLVTANQQETSQVNFAAQNRKDSRKTATEISASQQASQALSTVQVVLFSNSLRNLYSTMFNVIQSRVQAGLLKVQPVVQGYYNGRYSVKASGDVDVIERQQLVQSMMTAWPVMQTTAAAPAFLADMLSKMFPDNAAKYIQILEQSMQQQQQQAQGQQAQLMQGAMQMGKSVVELSKHPEYFSDIGKIHALPAVQQGAAQIEEVMKGAQQ